MSAASRGLVTAFLLRAGFLVAALAVIAGLLGMHVVANGHSSHPGHPAQAVTSTHEVHGTHTGHAGHAGHQTELPPSAEPASRLGGASCAAAGDCPAMSGLGTGCVPAPGTATLAAPLLGAVPSGLPHHGPLRAGALCRYSYLPGSPSPGDLSISRT